MLIKLPTAVRIVDKIIELSQQIPEIYHSDYQLHVEIETLNNSSALVLSSPVSTRRVFVCFMGPEFDNCYAIMKASQNDYDIQTVEAGITNFRYFTIHNGVKRQFVEKLDVEVLKDIMEYLA